MYRSTCDQATPYDLWKQGVVTESNSIKLGIDRDILLVYDQSNKDHLTKVKNQAVRGNN
jgi:hypothetical protein